MNITDIRLTVGHYIPYASGYMFMNGVRYSETELYYHIQFDGIAVPYLIYQEDGFTHYITKKRVEVNMNFIKEDTTNALNFLAASAGTNEYSLIMAATKRTVQARINILSQGAMQQLTPGNRGGKDAYIG